MASLSERSKQLRHAPVGQFGGMVPPVGQFGGMAPPQMIVAPEAAADVEVGGEREIEMINCGCTNTEGTHSMPYTGPPGQQQQQQQHFQGYNPGYQQPQGYNQQGGGYPPQGMQGQQGYGYPPQGQQQGYAPHGGYNQDNYGEQLPQSPGSAQTSGGKNNKMGLGGAMGNGS